MSDYDKIDRFLRNNLDDTDYEEYSSALDSLSDTAALVATPEGLISAHRSIGRLILRFDTSDQLNAFYYACRAALAAHKGEN